MHGDVFSRTMLTFCVVTVAEGGHGGRVSVFMDGICDAHGLMRDELGEGA